MTLTNVRGFGRKSAIKPIEGLPVAALPVMEGYSASPVRAMSVRYHYRMNMAQMQHR